MTGGAAGMGGGTGGAGGGTGGTGGTGGGDSVCRGLNLIQNPGFELMLGTELANWTLDLASDRGGAWGATDTQAASGQWSLFVDSSTVSSPSWARVIASSPVRTLPGSSYTLTFQANGELIDASDPPLVFARTFDSSRMVIGEIKIASVEATSGFVAFGPFTRTAGPQVAGLQLMIEVHDGTRVLFDDFCLVEN